MFLLCHRWLTTTNLSYRFPILETSAALCGTTDTGWWFKTNKAPNNICLKNWRCHNILMFLSTKICWFPAVQRSAACIWIWIHVDLHPAQALTKNRSDKKRIATLTHTKKNTYTPENERLETKNWWVFNIMFPFQGPIFKFHVNVWECRYLHTSDPYMIFVNLSDCLMFF